MKIAIVGSGIAGLTCAYLLARRHDITVFEADARVGGHTHTVPVTVDGRDYAVDTGFIVFNDWTYPNFIRLLGQLGVACKPTEMSFSVNDPDTGLEYNGNNLNSLFAQRSNLLSPGFWGMLRDILQLSNASGATWLSLGPTTIHGHPRHPLYLHASTPIVPFDMTTYRWARP